MANDQIFTYRRYGFRFTVYPNRVEVYQRGCIRGKTKTFLIKNISNTEVSPLTGKLTITTNEGTHAFTIGRRAAAAQQAINQNA